MIRQPSFFVRLSLSVMGLLALLAFFYAAVGDHGYLVWRKKQQEKLGLQQKIEQLQHENKEIQQEIKALKTDPRAIEKIAREELGMVKPGEIKITSNPTPEGKSAEGSASDNSGTP
jgi:cell division protein FtsB